MKRAAKLFALFGIVAGLILLSAQSYVPTSSSSSAASLIAGSGISVSGSWPNQTIAATGGGSSGTFVITSALSAGNFSGTTDSPISPLNTNGNAQNPIGVTATLSGLYANITTAEASASSLAITVYKNSGSTALTCTIAASTSTCSDTSHTVSVVPADLIGYHAQASGTNPAGNLGLTLKVTGAN